MLAAGWLASERGPAAAIVARSIGVPGCAGAPPFRSRRFAAVAEEIGGVAMPPPVLPRPGRSVAPGRPPVADASTAGRPGCAALRGPRAGDEGTRVTERRRED